VRRFFRTLLRAVFYESREGRAAEIAAWSNALVGLAAGVALWLELGSWVLAFGAAALVFLVLRVALAHRVTVWIAAVVGTLVVATAGAALAWVFAHVIEIPSAPPIAAVLAGLALGALPGWAYVQLARSRANDVPDSLVTPVPSSRT
jgi:hypothetical protein